MSIITEDIPDIDFSNNPFNEWDDDLKTQIRVDDRVDDLRIFVGLAHIDGESKTLARARPLVAKQSFLENIAYTKIGAIAPDPASAKLAGAQVREWGDCILKGPIYVADENGRIIHIIE